MGYAGCAADHARSAERAHRPGLHDRWSSHVPDSGGGYHASKWAVEGLTDSLAQEVAGFGIKVTLVEPALFATDWAGSSAVQATPIDAYDGVRAVFAEASANTVPGNPAAVGGALLKIVDAENPPLRVFFGSDPLQIVPAVYADRINTWQQWAEVSAEAQG